VHTTTTKDGTTIAYERTGSGPALVHVGGALLVRGSGAAIAERLASRFTTYTYDRRGRGDSSDTAPYAVEREIEDLAAVIDAAGGAATVLGLSSGAALALRAAAAGVPITGLVLYEVPFVATPEPSNYPTTLAALLAEGRNDDALALFLTDKVGMPAQVVDGMRGQPMWPAMAAVAPTLRYDDEIMGDGTVPPWLGSVDVPTLAVAGGASPGWMRATARAVADALPNGRYRELDGQDHNPDPALLATAVTELS
jgi:pimeloyl-ACP methyl ester carboxylesterase